MEILSNTYFGNLFRGADGKKLQKIYPDVILQCGEETIKAHRLVLTVYSDFFAEELEASFEEDSIQYINCDGISFTALSLLVKYFYGEETHISKDNVVELLWTADYLRVFPVINKGTEFIFKMLGSEDPDVFDILNKCFLVLTRNSESLLHDKRLLKIPPACVQMLLSIDEIYTKLHGIQLLIFLEAWYDHWASVVPASSTYSNNFTVDRLSIPCNAKDLKGVYSTIVNKYLKLTNIDPEFIFRLAEYKWETNNEPKKSTSEEIKVKRIKTEHSTSAKDTDEEMAIEMLITKEDYFNFFDNLPSTISLIDVDKLKMSTETNKLTANLTSTLHEWKNTLRVTSKSDEVKKCYSFGGELADKNVTKENVCLTLSRKLVDNNPPIGILNFVPLELAPPVYQLTAAAATALDTMAYMTGGISIDGGVKTDNLQAYDYIRDRWTLNSKLNSARSNHGMCCDNNTLYCVGGQLENKIEDTYEYYDLRSNYWQSIDALYVSHDRASAILLDDKIYALKTGSKVCQMDCFDITAQQGITLVSPENKFIEHAMCIINNDIFVIGGMSNNNSHCAMYSISTNTWKSIGEMPVHWKNGGLFYFDGFVYCFGGEIFANGKWILNDTTFMLNLVTNEWSKHVMKNSFLRSSFAYVCSF